MFKIIDGMKKREVGIASVLVGIMLGMIISAMCMSYSLHYEDLVAAATKNCSDTNKAVLIDGYFWGTSIRVQCADGKTSRYPLVLHGNSVHVDHDRK
jgi:hypothetical protein